MPRIFFLALLAGACVTMTRSEPIFGARDQSSTRVVATPIPLDPEGGTVRVGALRYLGGWELRSADPRFGGISAMALVPGGLLAMSDSGTAMRMAGPGRVPESVRLAPLAAGPGRGTGKADRDSEAMTRDARHIWVAFEGHNSIWRYAPDLARAEASRRPPEMRGWRSNSGAEAMVRLPGGRFAVFSEGRGDRSGPPGTGALLLFDRDPTDLGARAIRLAYRAPPGFSVTDAALMADGRVMVLHRSFSLSEGVAAAVGIVEIATSTAGAVLEPSMIATLRPPLNVDNMEALALEQVGGRTHAWIASDDNFSALQRTLLLKFELEEAPRTRRRRR